MIAAALAVLASATCLASPVHDGKVNAGPFVGYVTVGYDVVLGRFWIHVGPYRVPNALTYKIPWFVPLRYRVGDARARTFRQTFARAYSTGLAEQARLPLDHRSADGRQLAPDVPQRPGHRFTDGVRLEHVLTGTDGPEGLSLQ